MKTGVAFLGIIGCVFSLSDVFRLNYDESYPLFVGVHGHVDVSVTELCMSVFPLLVRDRHRCRYVKVVASMTTSTCLVSHRHIPSFLAMLTTVDGLSDILSAQMNRLLYDVTPRCHGEVASVRLPSLRDIAIA